MALEVVFVLVACLGATVVAFLTERRGNSDSPNWAVDAYLGLLRSTWLPPLRRYADERKTATYRERFLAAWFLSFFLIFLIGIFFLPSCGRHSC
jgi:hypothetical protein